MTPTATPTLAPTATPLVTPELKNDQVRSETLEQPFEGVLSESWLSFVVINDPPPAAEENDTAQPLKDTLTVVLADPDSGRRYPIVELPAATENRIVWSPTGLHLVYFLPPGEDETRPEGGLFLLDIRQQTSRRLLDITTLQPRGIPEHQPFWSPDGQQLLLVLPNAYATDVYVYDLASGELRNMTQAPSYDFWATWSPDGRQIAFVSDRRFCPTWEPGQTGTCFDPDAVPPAGGNLYLLDLASDNTRIITSTVLNRPPRWVNERYIAVSGGSLDAGSLGNDLWLYDIEAGSAIPITPDDGALHDAAAWSPDAEQVLYHRVSNENVSVIQADRVGNVLGSTDSYIFPRFGITMDWSANGQYVAIGGRNGQCPYGLIVFDANFRLVTAPARDLLACDPVYAPGGRYMAFEGTRAATSATDGRLDVYVANLNGLGARNFTGDYEERVNMLGWVGPPRTEDDNGADS
jgi:Tol biopolymer transport system component